jgi:MFS transporter, DHA1 family, solute carrier family 18 (vesicular amine transporter), member 1/2
VTEAAGKYLRSHMFRLLIYGLVLASSGAQFAIVPVMPIYAQRFGLSGFQQGMVLGATGLATLAVSVPAGALSDRFGARRLTLWAGLVMTFALFTQSLASGFPMLFGSRLVFGIGYGVVWTAGLSWIADTIPAGSGLGGSVASAGVGCVAGPAASGVLVQYFGLMVPLLATAAGFALITIALSLLRVPTRPSAPSAPLVASLRATTGDRNTVCAAAAIVIAGITMGVFALLVPAQLHAAGASTGRIGLYFSIAGMLFVAGSTLTAFVGQRALRIPVICGGMLAIVVALSPGVLTAAPLAIIAMLCITTAARSVVWTISYPLAAEGSRQSSAGLGVVVGLLNAIWAAAAVLSPLGAGVAVEHLSPRTVLGLTQAVCALVLAATVAVAYLARQPGHPAIGTRLRRRTNPAAAHATGGLVSAQCRRPADSRADNATGGISAPHRGP